MSSSTIPGLLEAGQQIALRANEPLLLHDPDRVWSIKAGKADVFAVSTRDGTATRTGQHLFRAEPGDVLFGLAPLLTASGDKWGLMVVGLQDSSAVQISRADFEALADDPGCVAYLSNGLDRWILNLSSGIILELTHDALDLQPGKAQSMPAGTIAHAREVVVWAAAHSGLLRVFGKKEFPISGEDDFLPTTRHIWVQAVSDSELTTLSTGAMIASNAVWPYLNNFQRLILNQTLWQQEEIDAVNLQRLQARSQSDQQHIDLAIGELSAVIKQQQDYTPPADLKTEDAIWQACKLVADGLGISLERPPIKGGQLAGKDWLDAIAEANSLRLREVKLQGDWWVKDGGPMLGTMQDSQHAVALLPRHWRGYVLVDPVAQTRTPIDPALSKQLVPFVFELYPTLPAESLHVRTILSFATLHVRQDILILVVLALSAGIFNLFTPILTGLIFDQIVPAGIQNALFQVIAVLLVGAFSVAVLRVAQNVALTRVASRASLTLQVGIIDRLLRLPMTFFRQYSSSDLVDRTMGAEAGLVVLSAAFTSSLLAAVFAVFNLLLLLVYDSDLAIIAVVLTAIAAVVTGFTSLVELRYQRRLSRLYGQLANTVVQLINGVPKLRIAGAENRAFSVWAQAVAQQRQLSFKLRAIDDQLVVFNVGFLPLASLVALVVIALRPIPLSTGILLAANAAFAQFFVSGLSLTRSFVAVLKVLPQYERLQPVFSSVPEQHTGSRDPGKLSGAIEVQHLSFTYPGTTTQVLKDITFQIKPGQFVGIVGPSGSGKSTLIRLLLGFEKPDSGGIFFDGYDSSELSISALRKQMGVVLQSTQLLPGDIFTNIVGESTTLSLEDAWNAARLVGIADDIEQMPMQMYTVISEGGGTFSGGQRQRLAIARAIVRKPSILLFDEATSALDNVAQNLVIESLYRLNATRIVIAHRLSTIMNADLILVVQDGTIVQRGTYDTLIEQSGLFRDLATRQLL